MQFVLSDMFTKPVIGSTTPALTALPIYYIELVTSREGYVNA